MADDDYGPGFQKAREAALARSNGVCQACGHFKATAAHHWQKRYSSDAEITPEHLTGLCDLCHEMVTTLRKALIAAEPEDHSEVRKVVDRLTERQKGYISDLFRQGGFHFPDEGFREDYRNPFQALHLRRERAVGTASLDPVGGHGGRRASAAFQTSTSAKPPRSSRRSKTGIGHAPFPNRLPLPNRFLLPNRLRLRSRFPLRLPRAGAPRVLGGGVDGPYSSC